MAGHVTGVSVSQNNAARFRNSQHYVHAATHENRERAQLLQNNSVRIGTLRADLHVHHDCSVLFILNCITTNFYIFFIVMEVLRCCIFVR